MIQTSRDLAIALLDYDLSIWAIPVEAISNRGCPVMGQLPFCTTQDIRQVLLRVDPQVADKAVLKEGELNTPKAKSTQEVECYFRGRGCSRSNAPKAKSTWRLSDLESKGGALEAEDAQETKCSRGKGCSGWLSAWLSKMVWCHMSLSLLT